MRRTVAFIVFNGLVLIVRRLCLVGSVLALRALNRLTCRGRRRWLKRCIRRVLRGVLVSGRRRIVRLFIGR